MFFVLSKLVYFVIAPSHLGLFAIIGGAVMRLWTRWQRTGTWLLGIGVSALVVLGFSPVGNLILLPLEERFPRAVVTPAASYEAIIMLGGFEDGRTSDARATLALNESGERLTETIRLAHLLPAAKVIFSGGPATLMLAQKSAGRAVSDYARDVGLAPGRLVLETRSANTWQNAVFTRDLLSPAPGKRYLLVTSAWHMPRAVGVFRKAGFDVDPWPADYRTSGPEDVWRPFGRMTEGLERIDFATKEWIGLLVYRLTGRSSALFPAPRG